MRAVTLSKVIVNFSKSKAIITAVILTIKSDIDGEGGELVELKPPKGDNDVDAGAFFLSSCTLKITCERTEPVEQWMIDMTPEKDRALFVNSELSAGYNHTEDLSKKGGKQRVVLQHTEFQVLVDLEISEFEVESLYKMTIADTRNAREDFIREETFDPKKIANEELGPAIEVRSGIVTGGVDSIKGGTSSTTSHNTVSYEYAVMELNDGTIIIAGEYELSKLRPLQLMVPLHTLVGGNAGLFEKEPKCGLAACPLAILSGWREGGSTLTLDSDFNLDGVYQYGHLVMSAAGAPHNSFIIAPMHQAINGSGPWRKIEQEIERMTQHPGWWESKSSRCAAPVATLENCLATLTYCLYSRLDQEKLWDLYAKISIAYDRDDDPRVPSAFRTSLHRKTDDALIVAFDNVEQTDEAIVKLVVPLPPPSNELKAVFARAEEILGKYDLEGAKQKEPQEWHPLYNDERWPLFLPEDHVHRPYRCLDVLMLESGFFPWAFESVKSAKEKEILEGAYKTKFMKGGGFSEGQRQLATLFNVYKNGKFLSDVRPSLPGSRLECIKKYYNDPVGENEIGPWGGDRQAHADHHVPKGVSGSNHFTNLLFVSKKQNLSAAQTKPHLVTNPRGSGVKLIDLAGRLHSSDSSTSVNRKKAEMTNKETVTRSCQKFQFPLTREKVVERFKKQWIEQQYCLSERHLFAAQECLAARLKEKDKCLPWSPEAKEAKQMAKKMMFS